MARPLRQLAEALLKRSVVIVISDLLDDPASVVRGLRHLRSRGNDVVVFQFLDPDELTFPFRGATRFHDLEDAAEVIADPLTVRDSYMRELQNLTDTYARELRSNGIDYVQLDTSQPLDRALTTFLSVRERRS